MPREKNPFLKAKTYSLATVRGGIPNSQGTRRRKKYPCCVHRLLFFFWATNPTSRRRLCIFCLLAVAMALREILHTLDMKRLFCHSKWHRFFFLSGRVAAWDRTKYSPFATCALIYARTQKSASSHPIPPTFPPPWRKAGGGREGESPHHRPSPPSIFKEGGEGGGGSLAGSP